MVNARQAQISLRLADLLDILVSRAARLEMTKSADTSRKTSSQMGFIKFGVRRMERRAMGPAELSDDEVPATAGVVDRKG